MHKGYLKINSNQLLFWPRIIIYFTQDLYYPFQKQAGAPFKAKVSKSLFMVQTTTYQQTFRQKKTM